MHAHGEVVLRVDEVWRVVDAGEVRLGPADSGARSAHVEGTLVGAHRGLLGGLEADSGGGDEVSAVLCHSKVGA